jgi:hypothetical protein
MFLVNALNSIPSSSAYSTVVSAALALPAGVPQTLIGALAGFGFTVVSFQLTHVTTAAVPAATRIELSDSTGVVLGAWQSVTQPVLAAGLVPVVKECVSLHPMKAGGLNRGILVASVNVDIVASINLAIIRTQGGFII